MSIQYYGMPMQPSSQGLDTLFNYGEQGSAGAERVFLDEDIASKIYSLAETESEFYKNASKAAEEEFNIQCPEQSKVADFWNWMGQCIGAGLDSISQFVKDSFEFITDLAGSVISGSLAGLSSGLGNLGPILLIGAGVAAFVILS